jgi:hypothetical protein
MSLEGCFPVWLVLRQVLRHSATVDHERCVGMIMSRTVSNK